MCYVNFAFLVGMIWILNMEAPYVAYLFIDNTDNKQIRYNVFYIIMIVHMFTGRK